MSREKRIMVIAGEASGDLHASRLVSEIGRALPNVRFAGVGGSGMRRAGVDLIFDNREIAVTGFSEVLSKAMAILKAFRAVKETLKRFRPDLIILLDFPDFNLRVGKMARKMGIPVFYYISPQVWAWRKARIGKIQELVEKIMVILPFEASLYGAKGVFVGHPLLDVVGPSMTPEAARKKFEFNEESLLITLLPGSRRNEVRQLLPVFVEAARLIREEVPGVQFALPLASTIKEEEVLPMIQDADVPIRLIKDGAYDALSLSSFAVVASGTATLEAAVLGVPMLIVYKMTRLSFLLAKWLVRVPHIGLINMVAGKRIVPEVIQDKVTPERIMEETLGFIRDRERSDRVVRDLKEAVSRLGSPGASARAANVVLKFLKEKA
jgi:lipid-A-disaccharide synthase